MTQRHLIAVAGNGTLNPLDPRRVLALECGRALVEHGYRVMCGGLGGVMSAVAEGARSSTAYCEGSVVGLLPGRDPQAADAFMDVVIPTGLGHLRNSLIGSADALIAIGGGAGTLSEMAFAWIYDRPILAFRVEGWSGRLADQRLDDRVRFLDRPDDRIVGVSTTEEMVAALRLFFPR
jgi:uncharacterized protein (TIGR00725 family)